MNVEAQIEKLQPAEGDVLVVRLEAPMTEQAYAELRQAIRRTEVGVPVIVLDEGEVGLADRARIAGLLGLDYETVWESAARALGWPAAENNPLSCAGLTTAVLDALRDAGVPLPPANSPG